MLLFRLNSQKHGGVTDYFFLNYMKFTTMLFKVDKDLVSVSEVEPYEREGSQR